MKVLVCAASKYGATGEIAKAVADVLAERGLDVAVIPPERASAIEQFDAVVLGSAVYMGRLVRKHLSFPDRAMASAIRAQEGDFRNWAESGTGQPASPETRRIICCHQGIKSIMIRCHEDYGHP